MDGHHAALGVHPRRTTSTSSAARASTQAFINSFIITIPATVLVVMVAAFAAYAFAWMEFPGRNILFVVVVGLLVVPLQVDAHPGAQPVPRLPAGRVRDQRDDAGGVAGAHRLRPAVRDLPAAQLLRLACRARSSSRRRSTGRVPSTSFFRLALPMSVPALASLIIFQFLWVWNDLLVALVYLGGASHRTTRCPSCWPTSRRRSAVAGSSSRRRHSCR